MVHKKLNKDDLFSGLVRHGLFPYQKKDREECPPLFSSSDITNEIAKKINQCAMSSKHQEYGFDTIQYRLTRYNNIPHPKAHIDLATIFRDHWDEITKNIDISTNLNSVIRPRKYKNDERIVIMNYELSSSFEKQKKLLDMMLLKKIMVKTDVANFFPSFYTHSIPWALEPDAKQNRDQRKWFNKIDKKQRMSARDETIGVPVGAATSNISTEIVLAKIDQALSGKFDYTRFIDDYVAFVDTHDDAEEFIQIIGDELSKYRLKLNIKKTSIDKLPLPVDERWVVELKRIIPNEKKIRNSDVINLLDTAVNMQGDNPEGSVLKFMCKSLVKKEMSIDATSVFLNYLLTLSLHYPILIPVLMKPLKKIIDSESDNFKIVDNLLELLKSNIAKKRSDAMCWLLYYLYLYAPERITAECAEQIIKTEDSLSITMLTVFKDKSVKDKVVDFAEKIIEEQSENKNYYDLDQYWLLLYQLFVKELIENPYKGDQDDNQKSNQKDNQKSNQKSNQNDDQCFEILRNGGVNFMNVKNND